MSTAKAGRAGRAGKAPVAAPATERAATKPKLVEDGPVVEPSVTQSGGASRENQEVSRADGNNSGALPPGLGEDNNKLLASLKEQVSRLADFLLSRPNFPGISEGAMDTAIHVIGELDTKLAALAFGLSELAIEFNSGEDLIEGVLRILSDDANNLSLLEGKLETVRGQEARLLEVLAAHPDFAIEDRESTVDAGIRLIGGLDAALNAATSPAFVEAVVTAGQAAVEAAAGAEGREAHGAAIEGEAKGFADFDLDEWPIVMRLSDGDAFIPSIPAIAVAAADLERSGDRVIYARDIDLDPTAAPARVYAAWLICGDKSLSCRIEAGLACGGGAGAKIPKGHLVF